MFQQILLALALASVTVVVHAFGTVHAVLPIVGLWKGNALHGMLPRPVVMLVRLVSGLLVLHVIEMALWALAYLMAGIFADFETALYFSLTSYTTVGYGDVVPEDQWRLLGPIEAAVGILMLGLSTSVTVAVVQRIYFGRLDAAADTQSATTAPERR